MTWLLQQSIVLRGLSLDDAGQRRRLSHIIFIGTRASGQRSIPKSRDHGEVVWEAWSWL